jgi:hypothetical protein
MPELIVRKIGGRMPDVLDAGPVQLRRRHVHDVPALVEAIEQSLPELGQWFAWAQRPPDLAEQEQRAADSERAFDDGSDYEFVIVARRRRARPLRSQW